MFIVINCLGMPFNGETIKTESLGGSETAAYYMAKELAKAGHKVTVFTNKQDKETISDDVRYVWAGNVSQDHPLGDHFDFYALNTPHDVLIVQRHPMAFVHKYASKLNYWWVHDLATIQNRPAIAGHLWNIDGVLCVSEFHKNQVCELYDLDKDYVHVVRNGVDLELFEGGIKSNYIIAGTEAKNLIYSSRPERGLDHLVASNGIMERLGNDYHLYVCSYDNKVEHMSDYYRFLYDRCEQLENVTVLGSLTKQELADTMRQCDALVYPTPSNQAPTFEEVSCITAMEAMAAGLPFISCDVGALSETCKNSGSNLETLEDGKLDLDLFAQNVRDFSGYKTYSELQLLAAKKRTWTHSCDSLLKIINDQFSYANHDSIILEQLSNSDVYNIQKTSFRKALNSPVSKAVEKEFRDCYMFAVDDTFPEHYEAYYEYEKERGVNYGEEDLANNPRFECVSNFISSLPDHSNVLDYGCAHGHYTINLAKRFPDVQFTGIDITKSNIEKAEQWAKNAGVANVKFIHAYISEGFIRDFETKKPVTLDPFNKIIAAEVLEHVADPDELARVLNNYLDYNDGQMIITTPFGEWEAEGYEEHYPWRAHLWHLERGDLHYLWGDYPNFNIIAAPSGASKKDTMMGSYITTFDYVSSWAVKDYSEMFRDKLYAPQQTVSVCMIVKDAEDTLLRCLHRIQPIATEIILAIDKTTTDSTRELIKSFSDSIKRPFPIIKTIDIESPLAIGFDEARNCSLEEATCDWIMWIDHDEQLIHHENLFKYLRNNHFKGYAIKQHHMSAEPLGCMKTDLPCRLFRNHEDIKFMGRVHEHPEIGMNEGTGRTLLIPDIEIIHDGYTDESVRRKRFMRNIDLMKRDRKDYPERNLGKFLWLRDLAQMSVQMMETMQGRITKQILDQANEGIQLWEELLESNNSRLVEESMEFYHVLSQILGGHDFAVYVDAATFGEVEKEGAKMIKGSFVSREHVEKLIKMRLDERTKDFDNKYLR